MCFYALKDRTLYINVLIYYVFYWPGLFIFCIFDALGFGRPEDPGETSPLRVSQFLEIVRVSPVVCRGVCHTYMSQSRSPPSYPLLPDPNHARARE